MTEKEFNLSEKIREAYPDYYPDNIPVEDIKEFIELLKHDLKTLDLTEHSFDDIVNRRAGDKLI